MNPEPREAVAKTLQELFLYGLLATKTANATDIALEAARVTNYERQAEYVLREIARASSVGVQDPEAAAVARVLVRFEAAVAFAYPDDMTPNGKRLFDLILEEERG